MILEMIYNIYSEKSLKSNFLHEQLVKTDMILNEKIFQPFIKALFKVNELQIQTDLKDGIVTLSRECGKVSWYEDFDKLNNIIASNETL